VAFAEMGLRVVGTDLSRKMIERARVEAKAAGVRVRFVPIRFEQMGERLACEGGCGGVPGELAGGVRFGRGGAGGVG